MRSLGSQVPRMPVHSFTGAGSGLLLIKTSNTNIFYVSITAKRLLGRCVGGKSSSGDLDNGAMSSVYISRSKIM